jgi:hypothetical protein
MIGLIIIILLSGIIIYMAISKQNRKYKIHDKLQIYKDVLTYYNNTSSGDPFCYWYKIIYQGSKDLNTNSIYDFFPEYASRATTPNQGNLQLYRNYKERIKSLKECIIELEDKLDNYEY